MRKGLVLGAIALAQPAAAETVCPVVEIELQTATSSGAPPQIVAWLEDLSGTYVETIYITQETGTFGLGNRPGRFDFNSGPNWPYGRRITTFPVWAHKHGLEWPLVVFQDGLEDNLSHDIGDSSLEHHYCRPLKPLEFDAQTCPSEEVHTDKGQFGSGTSNYPPREDLVLSQGIDDPSAEMFAAMNPFDAVSRPTPANGLLAKLAWSAPPTIPHGEYILWFEVAKESDMNATYNETVYPSPANIPFKNYGLPFRGQPSVLYKLPVTIGVDLQTASTLEYVGYGDPDGLDGNIRVPDDTISNEPGSGAGRLAVISKGGEPYRIGVVSRSELDDTPPAAPRRTAASELRANRATIRFLSPGDDGVLGRAQSYEIRYVVGGTITEANFATANLVAAALDPEVGGVDQTFTIEGLLPETAYSVGIRAVDNCRNVGEVDACFIATAAYGSVMADDVTMLRRFRDGVLAKTVFGELAIEAYYTFGPSLSGVVGESDLLRATARDALAPLVDSVRGFRF